jgi:5,10-methylenetetrahydromethanopterin reductase
LDMGLGIGFGYDPAMSAAEMAGFARLAEEKRFSLAFFSETLQTFRDAVSTITVMAQNTSRMQLGYTQIARLRSPLVLAQTAASLDEISGGRIVLSLGACTEQHCLRHGVPSANPAKSLEEYLLVFKRILAGGSVDFDGEYVVMKGGGLGFKPPRADIPVWVAATSLKGLKLAGRVADGVLLNATTSVEYCRNAVRIFRESAREAGRDPDTLDVAGIIVTAVSHDRREAVNMVRREVASKFSPLMVDFAVRPRVKVGEPFVSEELIQSLHRSYMQGGLQRLIDDIPEEVLLGLTASGTASDVLDRVEQYIKAGVKLPIIRPAQARIYREVIESTAPLAKAYIK